MQPSIRLGWVRALSFAEGLVSTSTEDFKVSGFVGEVEDQHDPLVAAHDGSCSPFKMIPSFARSAFEDFCVFLRRAIDHGRRKG